MPTHALIELLDSLHPGSKEDESIIDTLKICAQYVLLDLEATTRERDYLEYIIELAEELENNDEL